MLFEWPPSPPPALVPQGLPGSSGFLPVVLPIVPAALHARAHAKRLRLPPPNSHVCSLVVYAGNMTTA